MRTLQIVYVLPARYDDEGYVLRHWRGVLPSNTLCCLRTLTEAVADSGELGPDVKVSIEVYDDTVQRIPFGRIARGNRQADTQVVVGLVGVQTNQFVRASDIALEFRGLGVPVMVGGFHVSGTLAVFGAPTPELQHLLDAGVTLVKGEVEGPGVLAKILKDALAGELRPIYDIVELPDLLSAPVPCPDEEYMKGYVSRSMGSLDTSRGCPFNCSFCTVINVQGKKMRHRSAACILERIEQNHRMGVTTYFFTDDNFARSPVWEELLDGLIALRARGVAIAFMIQVDTMAYRLPGFVEKAAQAGCFMAFIGMESVNQKNMDAAGKKQNRVTDYAEMAETWHHAKILVHVGYIIGMPYDTRDSVKQDVETLMNDIKVDEASFFMLTPLPGSQDHRALVDAHVPLDADLNNYDTLHETLRHNLMKPGEWAAAYRDAWDTFYNKENITNILLRTPMKRYWKLTWILLWYRYATLAGLHPMFMGLFRLKHRADRRALFPRVGFAKHAWHCLKDFAWGAKTYARLFFEFQEIWMLTRKPQDPRWATLADIRTRWAGARKRIADSQLRGQYDAAVHELREMLRTSADRLKALSAASKDMSRGARRRIGQKAQEIENYLRSIDLQTPSLATLREAEKYVAENLVAGYEELAIRYVAKRRQFNEVRADLVRRIKTGRFLTLDVGRLTYALLFELVVGLRFGITFFSRV